MSDDRRPRVSATGWVALGSTVGGGAAFLFQVVGTRVLGPVAYAPISVLWTLQYLWVAVAVTALEAYIARLVTVGGEDTGELRRFLRLFHRWLLATAALAAAAGVVLRGQLFAGFADLAVVLGLVVLAYGWYAVVRGRAAGADRFRAYGLATIVESGLRLVVAAAVLAVAADARALAWVFPIGPAVVLAWAAARRHPVARRPGAAAGTQVRSHRPARRFLAATSTANAAVQFLLAGGPLVLIPLGADAVTISVFFTTITAARVPMTFALNGGLSRVLPPLTRMGQAGDEPGLRRATRRMLAGILGGAVLAAVGAALAGPTVLAWLFGEAFRPGRTLVVAVAVGSVLAVGGLLVDQLHIALGTDGRLPAVWLPAVGLGLALVVLLPLAADVRVAVAFAAATGGALLALSVPLLSVSPRPGEAASR